MAPQVWNPAICVAAQIACFSSSIAVCVKVCMVWVANAVLLLVLLPLVALVFVVLEVILAVVQALVPVWRMAPSQGIVHGSASRPCRRTLGRIAFGRMTLLPLSSGAQAVFLRASAHEQLLTEPPPLFWEG